MPLNQLIEPAAARPRTAAILLGNLVPVIGVLFLGWDAFDVVFVYWLENAVIGIFNVLKMALADSAGVGAGQAFAKAFVIPFFCVHYGIFMLVHLVFIFVLLGSSARFGSPGFAPFDRAGDLFSISMIVAVSALVAEHGYEFYREFWKLERRKETNPVIQMFAPYGRIIVLHLVILFGAFAMVLLNLPAVMAVLLVVIKTVLELRQSWQTRYAASASG